MGADLLKIVDKTILDTRKLLTSSADSLFKTLHDFVAVTRSKAEINLHEKNFNLETKLRSAQRQNAQRKGQLCKLWTDFRVEIDFINEIITQNCTLIVQQQQKDQKLIAKEKIITEREMMAKQKQLQQKYAQIYQVQESNLRAELENIRANNMQGENDERNRWKEKKEELKNMLMEYDAKMFTQQEELENILDIMNQEADELHYFKQACTSQENPYNELMREKEEYLEQQRQQKLYEIRLKIAKRTIVKFIEDHYPAWKKKKLKSMKKKKKYKF